jgi:hypothetical protein
MKQNEPCKRVLLAGENGCRVLYCEACQISEIEIGALSLRLEEGALHQLHKTIEQALIKLSVLKALQVSPDFRFDQLDLH